MSLEAWGDEGSIADGEQAQLSYDEGFNDGWTRALERVALMLEGVIGAGQADAQISATSHAMTFRAMKSWAREGRAH